MKVKRKYFKKNVKNVKNRVISFRLKDYKLELEIWSNVNIKK